jgi:hypothetical protein
VVPAVAVNVSWLAPATTPEASSLLATSVNPLTVLPVYTARIESNELPRVSTSTAPLAVAVQLYQTEAPPMMPAWSGSPACFVAATLVPAIVAGRVLLTTVALANMSFGGAVGTVKLELLVAVPPGVVTEIVPLVAPPGTDATICVAELTVNDAASAPLKLTDVAPVRFVPVIVTTVPATPDVGENEVIDGGEVKAVRFSVTVPCAAPVPSLKPSTAIRYVVPATAVNPTWLWRSEPASSLLATRVRAPTVLPVYAASSVSNVLPNVSIVTGAVTLAVQLYQSDAPPAPPGLVGTWIGSPASLVAPKFWSPALVTDTPLRS